MPVRYDKSVTEKAVRLVREHAADYPSEYAAITAISGRLGMSAETLRGWVRQAEADAGGCTWCSQRGGAGDPRAAPAQPRA